MDNTSFLEEEIRMPTSIKPKTYVCYRSARRFQFTVQTAPDISGIGHHSIAR